MLKNKKKNKKRWVLSRFDDFLKQFEYKSTESRQKVEYRGIPSSATNYLLRLLSTYFANKKNEINMDTENRESGDCNDNKPNDLVCESSIPVNKIVKKDAQEDPQQQALARFEAILKQFEYKPTKSSRQQTKKEIKDGAIQVIRTETAPPSSPFSTRVLSPYFAKKKEEGREEKKANDLVVKNRERGNNNDTKPNISPNDPILENSMPIIWKHKKESEEKEAYAHKLSAKRRKSKDVDVKEPTGILLSSLPKRVVSKSFAMAKDEGEEEQEDEIPSFTLMDPSMENYPCFIQKKKKKMKTAKKEGNETKVNPPNSSRRKRKHSNAGNETSDCILLSSKRVVSKYFINKKEGDESATIPSTLLRKRVVSRFFLPKEEGGKHRKTNANLSSKATRRTPIQSIQLSAAEKLSGAYERRSHCDHPWIPPPSEHRLIQESFIWDPWRVLVICILLNRTRGTQVERMVYDLFQVCRNAKEASVVSVEQIEEVLKPLGLHKKRARMIKRFSQEYLDDNWTHVTQLHGVGKYAADAYAIFINGNWDSVVPNDHKLLDYWKFLKEG